MIIRWCLPEGYQERLAPGYCDNSDTSYIFQPEVYELAASWAQELGRTSLIDLGCGCAGKLVALFDKFQVIGVDTGPNIIFCQEMYAGRAEWIDCNLEDESPAIDKEVIAHSVVICADVIEHLVDPSNLIANLAYMIRNGARVVLSTPDRDVVYKGNLGPPANPTHVREWNKDEFVTLLRTVGLQPMDVTHTLTDDQRGWYQTLTVRL